MDAPYGLKPAGIQVQQAPWPTVTTVQIGEKMSNLFLRVDFPLKNRRTLQVLNATLSVHGRTADGMGTTTGRPTMGETRGR